MNLRVLAATAILRPALALALIPYLAAPFLVGTIIVLIGIRRREAKGSVQPATNPLQFMSALQMAVLFQVVLFAVHAARSHWGTTGLLVSGAVLGFTDVDVLTISMAKSAEGQIPIPVAAEAIAIGILSNTILKLVLGAAVGKGQISRTDTSLARHHGRCLGRFHRRAVLVPSEVRPGNPAMLRWKKCRDRAGLLFISLRSNARLTMKQTVETRIV